MSDGGICRTAPATPGLLKKPRFDPRDTVQAGSQFWTGQCDILMLIYCQYIWGGRYINVIILFRFKGGQYFQAKVWAISSKKHKIVHPIALGGILDNPTSDNNISTHILSLMVSTCQETYLLTVSTASLANKMNKNQSRIKTHILQEQASPVRCRLSCSHCRRSSHRLWQLGRTDNHS